MDKKLPMNNGYKIPVLGFGTWQLEPGQETKQAVLTALQMDYRLIDTAKIYGNESSVGEAIKESGVPREDIFVTTKLWNTDHGYEPSMQAFDVSMEQLGLDYLDLYLIHWPAGDARHDAWKALEEIYKSGRAKSIGVSNYSVEQLLEIIDTGGIVPAVNQVEFHPFNYHAQKELLEFCKSNDIIFEAYSPLAQGNHMGHTILQQISSETNKTVAQVMLRWALQQGTIPIPKSANNERIIENSDVFDFELSESQMSAIDNLGHDSVM